MLRRYATPALRSAVRQMDSSYTRPATGGVPRFVITITGVCTSHLLMPDHRNRTHPSGCSWYVPLGPDSRRPFMHARTVCTLLVTLCYPRLPRPPVGGAPWYARSARLTLMLPPLAAAPIHACLASPPGTGGAPRPPMRPQLPLCGRPTPEAQNCFASPPGTGGALLPSTRP